MKKHMSKIVVGIISGIFGFTIMGCQNLGNGKLDVPVELEVIYEYKGVEYHAVIAESGVSLQATDNLGNVYKVGYADDTGLQMYVSPTGKGFIQSEDGKLVLSLPDGTTVKVKKVE